ncbi:UDP-N-acetylmuramyl-tripeptide synthetase [Candidatus Kaiserbacteria bacterium]|nr:UDP-N-acetylmuramyl-tripeptide synthetase [Candidatus Kaiserbacteria bacterium]
MRRLKRILKQLLPSRSISAYHFLLAEFAALIYRYPSRHMFVVAVTGTKGKSSVTEMVNVILEEAGYTTAVLNSIRIKIGPSSEPNTMRMSMPGRLYLQKFLSKARSAGCDAVVLEMTSEGARQHRHRGIALDGLIFTNLAPEHIESHGSLQAYADAKFQIGRALARSKKSNRTIVANADDAESARYLALPVEHRLGFSLSDAEPWKATSHGGSFTFHGVNVHVPLPGEFSLKNALAAATLTNSIGIQPDVIARALTHMTRIPGRAESIDEGQPFDVIVDYAHTPDSLKALYSAYGAQRKICILGATGGGRDSWKRPVMGGIADAKCDIVVATNEDPYDENPAAIIAALTGAMKRTPEIVMDRRAAIARGLSLAKPGDAVLITGKGTDPTIQGPNGSSTPWSDATVAREELRTLLRGTPSRIMSS